MSQQTLPDSQVYNFVFQSASDGIVKANARGLLEEINPAAAAMLGVAPDEIIGQTPQRAFYHNPTLVNLFTRSGDQTFDVRLPRRRLAVGIATTLETGERMVMLQDVTEKRDVENRRESLVKAVVHDLRNPLSAITGFADLVDKSGELNATQAKFLTRLRQTTTKLQDVLGTLVDLAWIEAGMPLQHKPIQLRDVINDAVARISSLAKERKIVIAVSVQNPMPMVMGDPERLEQVIYNLLHNAVTYSSAEQSVAIHAWGDVMEVYCSVGDRGIGIADDELELIFDRMYRSPNDAVRDIQGGGLGLTVARTTINRHGGDIWVASNLGEGSTFTFFLPTVDSKG
jgi:two-component system, OmpR family, phosphate regulon sensor histidine kinase PhoR